MSRLYLSNPCAFLAHFLHTVLRAQSAPGFPCALFPEEGQGDCKAQAKSRREHGSVCPQLSSPATRLRQGSAGVSTGPAEALAKAASGRSSIPETAEIERRGRGVLDHPHAARVMTCGGFLTSH